MLQNSENTWCSPLQGLYPQMRCRPVYGGPSDILDMGLVKCHCRISRILILFYLFRACASKNIRHSLMPCWHVRAVTFFCRLPIVWHIDAPGYDLIWCLIILRIFLPVLQLKTPCPCTIVGPHPMFTAALEATQNGACLLAPLLSPLRISYPCQISYTTWQRSFCLLPNTFPSWQMYVLPSNIQSVSVVWSQFLAPFPHFSFF